jgi:hypothetical protein
MGLQTNDLQDLVYDIFEIDSFKSKMGEDKNIVVVSFATKTKESANDLMNFVEKGYPFVLDAMLRRANKQTDHIKYMLKWKEPKKYQNRYMRSLTVLANYLIYQT